VDLLTPPTAFTGGERGVDRCSPRRGVIANGL
jgi:hypothetical protein